ncbi:MAG TPA: LysM domain-containing protein [Flavisolibacter sp.]|jgi:LysM repeat protein|nr:LysM domain-containing protein [Flavisolibacter sp.]
MEPNRDQSTPYNEQVANGTAGGIITEYIVEEKDTLPDIARRYGVSIEEIMAANQEFVKQPSDMVEPGLRLMIPKKI